MLLDTTWVRARFPGLSNDLVFFENAGGSVPVDHVINRATEYLSEDMVQLGATYPRSMRATERVNAGIAAAAQLMHAEATEIALGASSTSCLYVLSHAVAPTLGPGDEVVISAADHEANRGAWIRMAAACGATLREWELDPVSHELTLAGLEAVLNNHTRLVCFTHCANVVGSIHDAKALVERIHDAGAKTVVDGVAYAPHRSVDVHEIGADAYVMSLYKVYGPHLGALFVRPEWKATLANQNHCFLEGKGMYELMPGFIPHELCAALPGIVDYLVELDRHHGGDGTVKGAFETIAAHEEVLAAPLLTYLDGHPRVRLRGHASADRRLRVPTITFTVAGRSSADIAKSVCEQGVAIRNGNLYAVRAMAGLGVENTEDGVVRASLLHYNTLAEVDRCIAAFDRAIDEAAGA